MPKAIVLERKVHKWVIIGKVLHNRLWLLFDANFEIKLTKRSFFLHLDFLHIILLGLSFFFDQHFFHAHLFFFFWRAFFDLFWASDVFEGLEDESLESFVEIPFPFDFLCEKGSINFELHFEDSISDFFVQKAKFYIGFLFTIFCLVHIVQKFRRELTNFIVIAFFWLLEVIYHETNIITQSAVKPVLYLVLGSKLLEREPADIFLNHAPFGAHLVVYFIQFLKFFFLPIVGVEFGV